MKGLHPERGRASVWNGKDVRAGLLPDAPPEKLFDRFYRSDAARTQSSGGCGIGLAVARSMAQANRGSLRAAYTLPHRITFTACF